MKRLFSALLAVLSVGGVCAQVTERERPSEWQNLVKGAVDCVVIDKQPALSFVEVNEGLKILDTEYMNEDYAAAVSKDNEPLDRKSVV